MKPSESERISRKDHLMDSLYNTAVQASYSFLWIGFGCMDSWLLRLLASKLILFIILRLVETSGESSFWSVQYIKDYFRERGCTFILYALSSLSTCTVTVSIVHVSSVLSRVVKYRGLGGWGDGGEGEGRVG